ncbi:MAG: 1-acyl-sn-glycerol-3-phosphate acyltransferase [Sphingosinicella sp.]|nr:1-acyl-sn-glycerol-3-phosphate acyltransferase [Sphingosinicella sp.]
MRLTLRVVMMALGLIALLPLHYLWKIAGRKSPWPRIFLGWSAHAAGMRARVTGRPLESHVLFVANHVSWLDILLVAGASGAAFVSKDEVSRWPIIGWMASLNDTIFVARTRRGAVRDQADVLRTCLYGGKPVALFPEGTTEGGAETLAFRPSLLASLFPPLRGVRVQPVAIDYGCATADLAWVGSEGAGANARRILSRKGTTAVTISFLDPLIPENFPDRKALAQAARRSIMAKLGASEAAANGL